MIAQPFFLQNIPSTVVKATLHKCAVKTPHRTERRVDKAHYHLKTYT